MATERVEPATLEALRVAAVHGDFSKLDQDDCRAIWRELSAEPTVPLADFSKALDEIYRLRRRLAYEASITEVHLEYKGFPKSRRTHAEQQVQRMRACARGESPTAYPGVPSATFRIAMEDAGASDTLDGAAFRVEG